MKVDDRNRLRGAAFVTGTCAFCGLLMILTSFLIRPMIDRQREMETEQGFAAIAEGTTLGEMRIVSGDGPVRMASPVVSSSGAKSGWCLVLDGQGYGGDFSLVAWYADDGTVKGSRMLLNSEVAGRVAEHDSYMKKFIGKGGSVPVPVKKAQLKGDESDGVSGATLTFSGVANALAAGSTYVQSLKAGK
jgi:Na+-translocating ferredoxin:NAD+ oxidoreductase RnfG subunit